MSAHADRVRGEAQLTKERLHFRWKTGQLTWEQYLDAIDDLAAQVDWEADKD